jgi:uncharacterized membrane protein YphA (DoxX/SURF4 family)
MAWAHQVEMPRSAKDVAVWLLSALLAVLFVVVGAQKLIMSADSYWVEAFRLWGYPEWFRTVVGIVEIAGGIALLIPSLAFLGAIALGVIMLGGTFTQLVSGTAGAWRPFVVLLLLLVIGWARRPTEEETTA